MEWSISSFKRFECSDFTCVEVKDKKVCFCYRIKKKTHSIYFRIDEPSIESIIWVEYTEHVKNKKIAKRCREIAEYIKERIEQDTHFRLAIVLGKLRVSTVNWGEKEKSKRKQFVKDMIFRTLILPIIINSLWMYVAHTDETLFKMIMMTQVMYGFGISLRREPQNITQEKYKIGLFSVVANYIWIIIFLCIYEFMIK